MSENQIHCHKCKTDQIWNFATTRRPSLESCSKICDQCATHEAFLDLSDNIVESGLLHREYSFFQLCCSGGGKSGHEKFVEFLQFRREVGKNDPSPKEIDTIIWKEMFGPKLNEELEN